MASRRNLLSICTTSLLACGLWLASPNSAEAAEVMCSNDFGECTVSNNGQSWISCSCDDESSTGGTGGDEYLGLTEAELMEICEAEVSWCDEPGGDGDGDQGSSSTTFGTEGTDTGGDGDGDTDDPDTEGATSFTTSTSGDGDGDPGDPDTSTGGDGDGDMGTGNDTLPAESSETGDPGSDSDSDEGDESGEAGETGGNSDSDSGSGTAEDSDSGADSESGETGTGSTGGADDDVQGCAVTSQYSGFGLLALSMLGLLGLRRREED